MQIAITATRHGLQPRQLNRLSDILDFLNDATDVERGRHGDCTGGDAQFHDLCRDKGIPISIHPPKKGQWRANKHQDEANGDHDIEVLGEKDCMVRNEDMVRATDLTIACPREMIQRNHGGTWRTWFFARAVHGKAVILVYPNGNTQLTNAGKLGELIGNDKLAQLRALLVGKTNKEKAAEQA